jgi:hypothetical protein
MKHVDEPECDLGHCLGTTVLHTSWHFSLSALIFGISVCLSVCLSVCSVSASALAAGGGQRARGARAPARQQGKPTDRNSS